MNLKLENITPIVFIKTLLKKISLPILLILAVTLFYIFIMPLLSHQNNKLIYLIISLAILKTSIIFYSTIKQLTTFVLECHSFNRLLGVFGLLIGLSVFSYATDYTCLFELDNSAFYGAKGATSYLQSLFHFFYFSLITFTTIGFGDIAPVSTTARFIVMLEIFISFLITVFALSNISKMHIKQNNK